jgi:hypothetical protein
MDSKKSAGRKGKLTPETSDLIVTALRNGNYIEHAVQAAGIGTSTFWVWMNRGEEEKTGRYREFRDAVKRAQADAVMARVEVIRSAGLSGSWQAAAWWLERTQPRYRNVSKIDLDVKKLSDEELDALISGNTTGGTGTP